MITCNCNLSHERIRELIEAIQRDPTTREEQDIRTRAHKVGARVSELMIVLNHQEKGHVLPELEEPAPKPIGPAASEPAPDPEPEKPPAPIPTKRKIPIPKKKKEKKKRD